MTPCPNRSVKGVDVRACPLQRIGVKKMVRMGVEAELKDVGDKALMRGRLPHSRLRSAARHTTTARWDHVCRRASHGQFLMRIEDVRGGASTPAI